MQSKNGNGYSLKIFAIVNLICLIAAVFTGCGEGKALNGSYRKVNGSVLETGVLATDGGYELSWDKDGCCILLKSLETGKVWSDILYDEYKNGSTSVNVNSSLYITVTDNQTLKSETVRSYSEIPENGKIVTKRLENGIRLTYFFDKYKIAVPIEYTLEGEALRVSLDAKRILETTDMYKIMSVTVSPYLCSVKNDADNGFLLVPSGSGAVMYSKETAEGTRKFASEVYGADVTRQVPNNLVNNESIRLPVFAACEKKSGMMGVIDEGAGAAFIEAQAGNAKIGYSNMAATFYVRGYDEFRYESFGTGKNVTTRVADDISQHTFSLLYYPLDENNSDYNSVALKYREYLMKKGMLCESKTDFSPYSTTVLGGTNTTSSVLGVPKKNTVALTTFNQAHTIVDSLLKDIGTVPVVRLSGYGDNGMQSGKIAGGKGIASVYGSRKDLEKFKSFCDGKKTPVFLDFDVVKFAESGSGFSTQSDVARTVIKKRIYQNTYSPIRLPNEDNGYYILAREKLPEACDYAVKKADKYGINAVCFAGLGSIAYSDFNDMSYYCKNGIEADVKKIINSANKRHITAVESANGYAAGIADVLFETPSDSGGYNVFDLDIPFYQMVFYSYKSMYSPSVNLSENVKKSVADAVAFGMYIDFSLTHSYVSDSDDLDEYKLYGTVFEDNKPLIKQNVLDNGYIELIESLSGSKNFKYEYLGNGISVTSYDNGKTVYVNHTDKIVASPVGEISAFGFIAE